jgi:hypothetical protein
MSDIVVRRMPQLSQPLSLAVADEQRREASSAPGEFSPQALAPSLIAEADKAARQARASFAPPTGPFVLSWVAPIHAGFSNPPSARESAVWAAAVAKACARIPAQAFTEDALIDLARASKFWPSASEVLAVVQPEANRLYSKVLAMERIARRKPPEAPPLPKPVLSDAERRAEAARCAEMVDRMKAAIAEREHRMRPERADRAAPVSLGDLMRGYERAIESGGPFAEAARMRLDKLQRDS